MSDSQEDTRIDPITAASIQHPLVFQCSTAPKDVLAGNREPLHLLPVKIKYRGPAPVSRYFVPEPLDSLQDKSAPPKSVKGSVDQPAESSRTSGNDSKTPTYYKSAFRGRQVTGRKLDLPEDCFGLVLQEALQNTPHPSDESSVGAPESSSTGNSELRIPNANVIRVGGVFNSFYVWNKDDRKHDYDHVVRVVEEFFPLAAALHGDDEDE